jgi:hypothetical protein
MQNRTNKRSAGRRLATLAATATVVVAATLATGASASASPVTPYLDCTTGSGQWPSGQYYGTATCTGSGRWLLRVNCSWSPFSYDSPAVVNLQDTQTMTYGNCWFGVESATVIPLRD